MEHLACVYRDVSFTSGPKKTTTERHRVLEMFVGIICACTPAAAKSCNHHLRNLGTLKRHIDSRLIKSGNQSWKTSFRSPLGAAPRLKTIKRLPGLYSTMDSTIDNVYQGSGTLDTNRSKTVQTFIQGGNTHSVYGDGIHLTFDLQNDISQAYGRDN